ncbi:spore germination protein (amino acid permease) [Paenibacillus sp. V4I3]|uniref:GerAB/ArcD/ProY family transporter n=1 Tax=Paenibacillus sp. V4I3 TaxID=3042305 RepID=UPI002787ECF9|nr:endospore germination permease [Paenibacillus sp. V4I3]MDQ0875944.1 spore germination protein (amino acid permease) [Paenibacillus sp. V4I3]
MESVRLNAWQFHLLTQIYVIGTAFILLPGPIIASAKQYGWIVVIWATLYGLVLAFGYLYLAKLYPGKTLIEIALQAFGKWAGGLVSLLYIVFFIQIASWVTHNLGDFMHINLMPLTPISIFHIMILLVSAYAVSKGIESIALVNELLVPYLYSAFWVPIVIMLREWKWRYFHVAYPFHLSDVVIQTRFVLAFPFMETVAFLMLIPFVQRKVKIAFITGIAVAGVMLTACVFISIGVLGVYRGQQLVYPIFSMFREMRFTGFIEHLEAILAVNIVLVVFIKLCILFYCSILGVCQLFKIEKRNSVIYPMIWVISAYSMLFMNNVENLDWIKKYLFEYYFLFAVALPILFIVSAKWRNNGRRMKKDGSA